MPVPPTFVDSIEASFISGASPKTLSVPVLGGDLILVFSWSQDDQTTMGTPTATGLAFAPLKSYPPTVDFGEWGGTYAWAATVPSDGAGTYTISMAEITTLADQFWSMNAVVYRNHGGVGASEIVNSTGAPSLPITTTKDNSAIVFLVNDWAAITGARTYRQINSSNPTELFYHADGAIWVFYEAAHSDAGAAGVKTVGVTAPATNVRHVTVAVEVCPMPGPPSEETFNSNAMSEMGAF